MRDPDLSDETEDVLGTKGTKHELSADLFFASLTLNRDGIDRNQIADIAIADQTVFQQLEKEWKADSDKEEADKSK
jgi:hypothetical protein